MSLHRLSAGAGYQYLLRHTACGDVERAASTSLTAYYTESGYPPGRWVGTGLAGLSPDDATTPVLVIGAVVTEEAMGRLFGSGHHPTTGEPLGRPYPSFRSPSERIADVVAKLPASLSETARAAAVETITRVELAKPHRTAVAGFDLTFTAPKSASTLWALGRPDVQQGVVAAHREAVDAALALVEDRFLHTRVGAGSVLQVPTRGMIAAAFDHWDTRAGDPNLHTHVVVANKVQGPDGTWRSLDSRALHHAVVAVSEVYDNIFADALTRHLPVGWGYRDRGSRRTPAFEVDGVRDDLLAEFSARSTVIDEAMAAVMADFTTRHGRSPNRIEVIRLRQQVTRTTRPGKTVRPLTEMLHEWRHRATSRTGTTPDDLVTAALSDAMTEPVTAAQVGDDVVTAIARDVLAGTMTRRSTWTRVNLLAETARATRILRLATIEDRHALHDRIVTAALAECVSLEAPDLVTLPPEYTRADGSSRFTRPDEHRYTATTVLDAEHRLLTACDDTTAPSARRTDTRDALTTLHTPPTSPAATATVDDGAAVPAPGVRLAPDQVAAVEAIATSGRRVDVLVGPAGTGKTTTLAALRAAWETTHGPGSVIGLAPSATAAGELADRLGITCENTAKWLYETTGPGHARRTERLEWLHGQRTRLRPGRDAERARTLQVATQALHEEVRRWAMRPGHLVIVDEASLAGTFTLDTLRAQAASAGAKLLLVGDHAQLSAVEAGGAFALLADRAHPTTLTSLWRFEHQWEAAATLALRAGNPRALTAYDEHDRITSGPAEAMLEDAYTAWQTDHTSGVSSILLAADAGTVTALNLRAHNDRVTDGLVTRSGVARADGTVIGVGELVLTRRNDRNLTLDDGRFVRNGDLWAVTATHPDGSLTVTPTHRGTRAASGSGDVRGAQAGEFAVRLPAAYVAEHVDLGYATTTHRAQGVTVDTAHLLAGPGMTREALYVGLTRGRAANRVYVAVDRIDPACDTLPDPHHVDAGHDILDRILATTGAETSATQTLATNLDQAGSLHTLTPIRDILLTDAAHRHWERTLADLGLDREQVAEITTSPRKAGLYAVLTRVHEAGHDLAEFLPRLLVPSTDDGDFTAVLTDRLTRWLDAQHAEPSASRPSAALLGDLLDPGDHAAAAVTEIDDLIQRRVSALTDLALLERPAWLTAHGSEPDPGPEHEAWLAGVTAHAAHVDTLEPARRPQPALMTAPPAPTAEERSLSA